MAAVIAVAVNKGGAGKTTTAMALAVAFARQGLRTLLIDVDPQGHAGRGLGVNVSAADGDDTSPSLTTRDLFMKTPPSIEAVVRACPTAPLLDIVPSTLELTWQEDQMMRRPRREEILKQFLSDQQIRRRYEWVFLDCPPSLSVLTQNALMAADGVLIPCKMEARADDSVINLESLLMELRPGWAGWRLLKVQFDARKATTNKIINESLAPWADRTCEVVIPVSEPLNQAQYVGLDIFTYDASCQGAVAYADLANELKQATWHDATPTH